MEASNSSDAKYLFQQVQTGENNSNNNNPADRYVNDVLESSNVMNSSVTAGHDGNNGTSSGNDGNNRASSDSDSEDTKSRSFGLSICTGSPEINKYDGQQEEHSSDSGSESATFDTNIIENDSYVSKSNLNCKIPDASSTDNNAVEDLLGLQKQLSPVDGGDANQLLFSGNLPAMKLRVEFVEAPTKLKSVVWKYFGFYRNMGSDDIHSDRTLCRLCNNFLAYNSGCTTNMRQHLIRSHGISPQNLLSLKPKVIGCEKPVNNKLSLSSESKPTLNRKNGPQFVDGKMFEFVPPAPFLQAEVWKYFGYYKEKGTDEVKYDKTWCKLCDRLMPYTGGNTSTMRQHLTRHHGLQFESSTSNSYPTATAVDIQPILNIDVVSTEEFMEKFEFVHAKPSLKALVWRYFGFYKPIGSDEIKFDYTCCKLCKHMVKYISGSTSAMRRHLLKQHSIDLDAMEDGSEKVSFAQSLRELKKLLKKQVCGNPNCGRPITLEADGSPPSFCTACGMLLSQTLAELWANISQCCESCGKIKSPSNTLHFCTRCGSYLSCEVEVFEHKDSQQDAMDSSDTTENVLSIAVGVKQEAAEVTPAPRKTPSKSNSKRLQCSQCDYTCSSERLLRTHARKHAKKPARDRKVKTNDSTTAGTISYECEFCNYKSDNYLLFTEHVGGHILTGEGDSESDSTSLQPDNQKGRLHHVIANIKEQKLSKADPDWLPEFSNDVNPLMDEGFSLYKCDYCLERFLEQSELDAHLEEHNNKPNRHTAKTPRVRHCKTCNAEFTSLPLLKKHQKSASCSVQMLCCEECGYITNKLGALRGHQRRNHGEIELKKCSYCDRKFKRQRNLEEHMNTHTGSTPFQCDKCGKAFHTNSSWYKHKRNKCQKGSRPRKLCSHCGKAVINLAKHISDVHFNIKEFSCPTCNKSFGTQYHLDRHMRIHTGEKPFPCRYCDYRASQKVVTDGHMRKCKFRPANETNPSAAAAEPELMPLPSSVNTVSAVNTA